MESSSTLDVERLSIYKAARTIKRRSNTLHNALRSIYEDSIFVGEISQLWPELPLLANLRCGLWYSRSFHSTCYFKSTDGHTNNWSFNTSRLNLHVALLAGQIGGCMIIDSTRKGKRFPDSMSKTIPIWTCVLNRAILNYRNRLNGGGNPEDKKPTTSNALPIGEQLISSSWDCSLHLPLWVSETEKALIQDRLEGWTMSLETSGADIGSLASTLKKPLRPLWISQKSVIWLNEVPEYDSWDFTPIILVSASSSSGVTHQQRTTSEFSWNYIPGAGDDEESWARGLSPSLFWKHAYDLISSGPDLCNQKVAEIVEKDRVYRAQRGFNAPQTSFKTSRSLGNTDCYSEEPLESEFPYEDGDNKFSSSTKCEGCAIFWIDSSNVAICSTRFVMDLSSVGSVLNCDKESESLSHLQQNAEDFLHLPIVGSKFDRFSLLRSLPNAIDFAKMNLRKGKRLIICCKDGEDISVCVCLAILVSLFNDRGDFDDGKSFSKTHITKSELRRRLVYICKFATNARPSRGNLKQVFNYLSGGDIVSDT